MQQDPEVYLAEAAELRVEYVGAERTPIMVIDNFAKEIAFVIQHACQQEFLADMSSYYPGIRARVPKSYAYSLLKPIYAKLREVFEVPANLRFQPRLGYYSLVTAAPAQLSLLQRIPHFDSNNTYYLAILHYLNDGDFGGTAFYRHKETGFERISVERREEYLAILERQFEAAGEPQPGYISGDTHLFEKIGVVNYKSNRLVVYPSNLLHSGIINSDKDINADPASGRLTANIFAEFY
jgi:hypothetical protein